MLWERVACRPPTFEGLDDGRGRCTLWFECALDGAGFTVLKRHLKLIEKPLLTFRAHAIKRAPQLFDLKPQPCDQRLGAGPCCLSVTQSGFSARRTRLAFHPRGALGEDQRMRGGQIGGKR